MDPDQGFKPVALTAKGTCLAVLKREDAGRPSPSGGLADIAGGIAHEFNNLLGAIQGFAGFLVHDLGKDSLLGRHASQIVGASQHGLDLVEQMLLLAGRGRFENCVFNISDLIENVSTGFAAILPPEVLLQIASCPITMTVEADQRQLELAIQGLCFNAFESLGRRSGTITTAVRDAADDVSVLPRLPPRSENAPPWSADIGQDGDAFWAICGTLPHDPSGWISVAVTDTGEGMDGELLKRAFDPFFTTRERALHPGLGLPVALGVAMAHRGGVVIRTQLGQGTSAHLLLPSRPNTQAR